MFDVYIEWFGTHFSSGGYKAELEEGILGNECVAASYLLLLGRAGVILGHEVVARRAILSVE